MRVNYALHVRAERPTPKPTRPPVRKRYRVQFRGQPGMAVRLFRDWWSCGSYETLERARQGLAAKRQSAPFYRHMDHRIWDAHAKEEVA